MGLLLDTAALLWLFAIPEKLSPRLREELAAADTQVAVSIVSLWEVLIKLGKGKLELDTQGQSALDFLLEQCGLHQIDILSVAPGSLAALEKLPPIHKDPFDRLLICQAIEHGLTLVTPDNHIRRYPIRTLW